MRSARGYFPKLTKSTFVVKPVMIERAKARFNHLGFQATTGTRYLGGFVRTPADKSSHIRAKVGEWVTGITHLTAVAHSPPKPPLPPSNRATNTSGNIYSA